MEQKAFMFLAANWQLFRVVATGVKRPKLRKSLVTGHPKVSSACIYQSF